MVRQFVGSGKSHSRRRACLQAATSPKMSGLEKTISHRVSKGRSVITCSAKFLWRFSWRCRWREWQEYCSGRGPAKNELRLKNHASAVSIGQELVQARTSRLGEFYGALSRPLLTVNGGCGNANQSDVGSIAGDGIRDQPHLPPVFACYHSSPGLIPVKDEFLIEAFLHQILIHHHGVARHVDGEAGRANCLPSCAG